MVVIEAVLPHTIAVCVLVVLFLKRLQLRIIPGTICS